jgi:UDP-N-acetylglucosamine diphosphorylase / glucose-1-phosphate thymidylyltransferase / UDP-N-acetylgalactosamine diphosphorylase / glucosamine-1-phosphate N-acetyltransferase / galactosamine-1-phosphate N-acetyltransferase
MSSPTLIILAGGASSRMRPLREKLLLRFGPEPLLAQQLKRFAHLGFADVIIVASPQNVQDIEPLARQVAGLNIQTVVQQQPLGMGDAVLAAAAVMDNVDGAVYINQIHDIVDDRLHQDMLAACTARPDTTFLAGYEMTDYFPGGYLVVDDDGRIRGMVEKPGPENRPSNLVNIVAHIHSHAGRLFAALREEYAREAAGDDHYERVMDRLMQEQVYQVVPYDGPWKFIKYPWHVLDVMDYFLGQIQGQTVAESAFIAPTASLVGDVVIGENVKIFPGAAVVGPAYIGNGTIIGNNALVRHSMVLDNCNVGFTTEVARSYVAADCQMHACRVLDSVFAENVNFSAGCTTANLRIDRADVPCYVKGEKLATGRNKLGAIIGKDAFLGVDVMTMPGVKVGENAQVGPGTHLYRDVEDGQRVYVKQELVVVDD